MTYFFVMCGTHNFVLAAWRFTGCARCAQRSKIRDKGTKLRAHTSKYQDLGRCDRPDAPTDWDARLACIDPRAHAPQNSILDTHE